MSVYAKLAEAREIVGPVIKTETADAGKYEYSYASLSSVLKAVDEACRKAIEDGGKDGGFVLMTGDQCGRDTPEENIFAFVEAAKRYGKY